MPARKQGDHQHHFQQHQRSIDIMNDQCTTAAAGSAHEGPLRPLKPLFMMPTPASTSSTASTASTAILYSMSGSDSDSDEQEAFLSKRQKKKSSRSKDRKKSRSAREELDSLSTSTTSSSSSTSPVVASAYENERKKKHKHRSHRHQKQYRQICGDDLEYGERHGDGEGSTMSHEWQVLREYSNCGAGEHGVLQVVHLKRANFGLKWRSGDPKDMTPVCMMGPHWWLMASTFTVFTGVALVITVLTLPKAGFGESVTGILLSTACLSMYAMVGCANPGIVQRIDIAPDDTYSYCDHCESYRPEGALHCMDCRVCIEGYDHHCPWTGKCVGKGNMRYFYAWLFFLVLAFVYEVIEFTTYMLPPEDQPSPSYYDDLTFAPVNLNP